LHTLTLVNGLLTIFIRVNIPPVAGSVFDNGGLPMKKHTPGRWSFWTWLLGGGQTNGGASG
jgi:hypothetical protein